MRTGLLSKLAATALAGWAVSCAAQTHEPPSPRNDIRLYQVAHGFVPEVMDRNGMAQGTGFKVFNKWGQYTAYLMATNHDGERTWRIEHYLPLNGTNTAQGSTMYLLEGSDRALLIDTANPATFKPGVNDLKTVVRDLLAHDNDGRPRAHPLDFVVANTHKHGDHIGENVLMSDRTVYYMDGDWPDHAPDNYVPIREGGGSTPHGKGRAVGAIDLGGGRIIKALAMPPHTDGSTGYLDAQNRMLFSGDAMGSAWPWLQWASITTYARTMHHIEEVTRAYPDLIVFPAHFYQTQAYGRSAPPISGRPLDRQYIVDQMHLAEGLIAGTVEGEPYPWHHSAAWAKLGTARLVYSLDHLAEADQALPSAYHAIHLPGTYQREWTDTTPPSGQDIDRLSDIGADVHIIRQVNGPSLFLINGSEAALLIGTGTGAPGLAEFVSHLIGQRPLDVALLDSSEAQTGGLAQLKTRHVYAAADVAHGTVLKDGVRLDLGRDNQGHLLQLEAQTLHLGASGNLTLRDINDRMMFVGAALGRTSLPRNPWADETAPFPISDPIAYQVALSDWSSRTIGRYNLLYVAGSADWYLSPDYVNELAQVLLTANFGKGPATKAQAPDGRIVYTSTGAADVRSSVVLAR